MEILGIDVGFAFVVILVPLSIAVVGHYYSLKVNNEHFQFYLTGLVLFWGIMSVLGFANATCEDFSAQEIMPVLAYMAFLLFIRYSMNYFLEGRMRRVSERRDG